MNRRFVTTLVSLVFITFFIPLVACTGECTVDGDCIVVGETCQAGWCTPTACVSAGDCASASYGDFNCDGIVNLPDWWTFATKWLSRVEGSDQCACDVTSNDEAVCELAGGMWEKNTCTPADITIDNQASYDEGYAKACADVGSTLDCANDCGGDAVMDLCGVCNGPGIPEGACDCEGNPESCQAACEGGDAEACTQACNLGDIEACGEACSVHGDQQSCNLMACYYDGDPESCQAACQAYAVAEFLKTLPKNKNPNFQWKSWKTGCGHGPATATLEECLQACSSPNQGCCETTCQSNSCSGGGCCNASKSICRQACTFYYDFSR